MYENRKIVYSFMIDRESLKMIQAKASKSGLTTSEYIRALIAQSLEKRAKN